MKPSDVRKALARMHGDVVSLQGALGHEQGPQGPLWGSWREWSAEGHQQPALESTRSTGLPSSVTERIALADPAQLERERDELLRCVRDAERLTRRAADIERNHMAALRQAATRCQCGGPKDPRAQACQRCATQRRKR